MFPQPASVGTSNAFVDHAKPHLDALYALAYRLTRSVEDAEDLVQETCLRGFRYFDRFQLGTNLRAWLFRILRNVFINSYWKQKAGLREIDCGSEEAVLDQFLRKQLDRPDGDPESELIRRGMDEDVARALASLPASFRRVVVLADIHGYSYKEVAAALDIPAGTVMSRLHRGRRLLEAQLLPCARRYGYLPTPPSSRSPRALEVACAA